MTQTKRNIIEINEDLCNGCGECVPNCAEGAIQIVDGKAKLISDMYCDGLGACLGHCPEGALKVIEREADEFDEEAVKELLASQGREFVPQHENPPMCPSVQMKTIMPGANPAARPSESVQASTLCNWPVQLRLVPPGAPFLKNADILIAADCTAFASPSFHGEFLSGKALLIGCPKLDNAQEYVNKLTEIFREAKPKSISVLVMEVPCCQGMRGIVNAAAEASGTSALVETTVLGINGEVLQPVH